MRLTHLPALLLLLLPHLGWGSPLTTTLYREVSVPTDAQLQAMYDGLRRCAPAQIMPHAVFAPLGIPFHRNTPRLVSGQSYRLGHPVSMGERLLLTDVSRQGADYRLRFNKSLTVYVRQLPTILQDIVSRAGADAPAAAFTLSEDGRVLTCHGVGR